jgi:hypothetical protein
MKDDILTYRQMCDNENCQTIQRGMNYQLGNNYSILLMSQRSNAPYNDKIYEDGITIEYEGHDAPKTKELLYPKQIDQPQITPKGKLTQNGMFIQAVKQYKKTGKFEMVRIYEKIFSGVWSDRGFFRLVDYKTVSDGKRNVFRFILQAIEIEVPDSKSGIRSVPKRSRIIPTEIKKIVWERDKGRCVICGAKDELHFDHDIPYSKGGTSITAENVKILCARHNIQKSDRIE